VSLKEEIEANCAELIKKMRQQANESEHQSLGSLDQHITL